MGFAIKPVGENGEGGCASQHQPVAQGLNLSGEGRHLGYLAMGGLQHAARYVALPQFERVPISGEMHPHTALVGRVAQPRNEASRFQAFEQRGQRAEIEREALA
jgi:hypothetical protein